MTTRLTLGHSPDSDDAFMFYGLAAGRVAPDGLEFEHVLRDIQTLNEWAREGRLDCTAVSAHAYAYVHDRYAVLTHGASMGDGYGPMVVARSPLRPDELPEVPIAVPGTMTSAFLALSLFVDRPFSYTVIPFDRIMEAVLDGQAPAGLIIHEGQLTAASEGLHTVVDLGAWWRAAAGLPLPLGLNTVRRDLPGDVQSRASAALKASILYSLAHRQEALDYAMRFARDMQRDTADRFVGMYVNDWTVDLGTEGRRAIRLFLDRAADRRLAPRVDDIVFVD